MYIECINYGIVNTTINYIDVARQIAYILNTNNNLKKIHSINTILNSNNLYLIELFNWQVLGCVGILDIGYKNKIVHLSVLNTVQKCGIGYKLLKTAINISNKNEIYMQIRDDNVRSINLAYMNGFESTSFIEKRGYSLLNLSLTKV